MFIINIPYLDLDTIYESGQGFRWKKAGPSKYVICNGPKAIKVNQVKERIIFDCSEEDFFNYWYDYFDLGTDYLRLNNIIRLADKDYLGPIAVRSKGLRIIRQDLFEVMIASLINANPNKTRSIINNISTAYSKKNKRSMKELGVITWRSFPNAEEIINGNVKVPLRGLTDAYRPILKLCHEIQEGWLDLDKLKSYNYREAMECLMAFEINVNIAKKICLHGLHKMKAFPVDYPIKRIFKDIDMDRKEFYEEYITNKILKRNAGLIYQYLWFDKLNPPISYIERNNNGYFR